MGCLILIRLCPYSYLCATPFGELEPVIRRFVLEVQAKGKRSAADTRHRLSCSFPNGVSDLLSLGTQVPVVSGAQAGGCHGKVASCPATLPKDCPRKGSICFT